MTDIQTIEAVHDVTKGYKTAHADLAHDRLRSLVDRIERLDGEKTELASDIKDIYAEAKSSGFDVKVLRKLIADRKKDAVEVEEQYSLLDLYKKAMGG